MNSIMQIDGMGKRYGMLPSQVIRDADTFDLYIMDAAMTFEHYHNQMNNNGGKAPVPDYSSDELLKIFNGEKLDD